jgi:uncharacterized protein (DUF2141 family)
MLCRYYLIVTMLLLCNQQFGQSIEVEIDGIRNRKGVIRLAVFNDEASFKTDTPMVSVAIEKELVNNGRYTQVLTGLKPGRYGIALLDDENRNGKLDYRYLLPAEGIGFSNYMHKGIKRPKFEYFCFDCGIDSQIKVNILVRYY